MNDEVLARKLGLYYHPLFQAIVQEWASVFQNGQNAMDIITFMEINLRAQKAILPEIDFENSLASALNDWTRELKSLSQNDPASPSNSAKTKDADILKAVQKILETFPFDLSVPIESYMSFFEEQLEGLKLSFVVDKLSTLGFGKFLFDLCYSWCENLDIELFSFFLISVFYQTIRFESFGYLQARSFDEVYYFPEALLVQIKLLKTHYSRYKKVDLTSYESWYEWNYLPNRISEIKQKILEVFSSIFKEDEHIGNYLQGLYWSSIQEITQKGLTKPSMTHFAIFSKENIEPKGDSTRRSSPDNDVGEQGISARGNLQKGLHQSKSWNQVIKKPVTPLFGRLLSRIEQEEPGQVRTLKSIEPFLGDIEPESQEDSNQKQVQLYPIWEHEVSDTTSVNTRLSFEKENPLKINKKIRNLSREKARLAIANKREEKIQAQRGHTPSKGNASGDRLKLLEESLHSNPTGFMQNASIMKARSSVSPRVIERFPKPPILSPTWMPKIYSETPNEHKTNVLSDRDIGKSGRSSAPLGKNKLRIVHSSSTMNLRNESLEENSHMDSKRGITDKKLMKLFGPPSESAYRPGTAIRSRHKGRTYKEVSSVKDEKVDLTIFGKSKILLNEEEDLLVSSREKYGLDLQAIEAEEGEKHERLEQFILNKTPKMNLTYRAQSTRMNRSPFREIGSPAAKGRTSRIEKRVAIDPFLQLSTEVKKDSYSHIKLQFPQTTGHRPMTRGVRQDLDPNMIGKNLRELFGKMKDKEEKNKRKQDIRMKRIKRPENKGVSQLTQLVEVKKHEGILPDLMRISQENFT